MAISNISRFFIPYSSHLAWIASISFNSNSFITNFKNSILLFNESIRVIFKLGNTIFNTNPGNPAPDPISTKDKFWFKSIILF